jgi:hypothetical protein
MSFRTATSSYCTRPDSRPATEQKASLWHKIFHTVRELPHYSVTIHELGIARSTAISNNAVDVEVEIQCSVTLEGASLSKSKAQRGRHYYDMTYILALTSDLDFIDFRALSRSSRKWVVHILTMHFTAPKPMSRSRSLSSPNLQSRAKVYGFIRHR